MTSNERVELKPCPFPHDAKRGPFVERDTEDFFIVRVSCGDCGCAGPYVPLDGEVEEVVEAAEAKAIAAWNTRHTTAPAADAVEAVRRAIQETLDRAFDQEGWPVVARAAISAYDRSSGMERLREAATKAADVIGDWARPTGANGMIPAGEDHPLCIVGRELRSALSSLKESDR